MVRNSDAAAPPAGDEPVLGERLLVDRQRLAEQHPERDRGHSDIALRQALEGRGHLQRMLAERRLRAGHVLAELGLQLEGPRFPRPGRHSPDPRHRRSALHGRRSGEVRFLVRCGLVDRPHATLPPEDHSRSRLVPMAADARGGALPRDECGEMLGRRAPFDPLPGEGF